MGWGFGIVNGREVGYSVDAICDADGCNAEIDRGVDYCCGSMHGGGEHGCGGYFCGDHLGHTVEDDQGELGVHYESLCGPCWDEVAGLVEQS